MTYANVNYADGFYGAFITKRSICSGYAKGLLYLAQRIGIRGAYVANPTHAWDNFFVEGKWYSGDSTGSSADRTGLLGITNGTAPANFPVMPSLTAEKYDRNLQKYGFMSIQSNYLLKKGEQFNPANVITVLPAVAETAPVANASYIGSLSSNTVGEYTVQVTGINTLGNTITGTCTVYVYKTASALSSYDAVQTGNSNYARSFPLCRRTGKNVRRRHLHQGKRHPFARFRYCGRRFQTLHSERRRR